MSTIFDIDPSLLEGEKAQKALLKGKLVAKETSLRLATTLDRVSWPLLVSVLAVSVTHLWGELSTITPVPSSFKLPGEWYLIVALLMTLLVDSLAIHQVLIKTAAKFAKVNIRHPWVEAFFLILTAALNAGFLLRYTPGVSAYTEGALLWLDWFIVVLLIIQVPYSIFFTEMGHKIVMEARLVLTMECAALRAAIGEEEKPSFWSNLFNQEKIKSLNAQIENRSKKIAELERLIQDIANAMGAYKDSSLVGLAESLNRTSQYFTALADELEISDFKSYVYGLRADNQKLKEELQKYRDLKALYNTTSVGETTNPKIKKTPEPKPLPSLESCSCGKPITQYDKAACGRGFWKEKLSGEVKCKSCREKLK